MQKNLENIPIWGHLAFWLTILIIGTATVYPYYSDLKLAFTNRAIFLPVWLIATYLNWYILMPRLLNSGQVFRYAIILFLVLFVLTVIQRYCSVRWLFPIFFGNEAPEEILPQAFLLGRFVQFGAFIALPVLSSIGIRFLMQWYRESYQAKQIIAQQKSAELSYLKAQINPHFLFNTLNNLYGLSLEESKKVPDLILKLSDILSYSLYESSVEKIHLYKEVKMIKDFIALEKERYEDRMKVTFVQDENLDENIEIAPLLLIPFVENAFKHGVKEATETVPVSIYLGQENGSLLFEVKNKIAQETPIIATADGPQKKQGLGLKNLQRRLNLLYPQQHVIETKVEGELFCAKLKLEIA